MAIQHRNIPDSELHEVKGAATAPAGLPLVANGDGTTGFEKLNVSAIEGNLSAAAAGRHVITDGDGGLTSTNPVFTRMTKAGTTLTPQIMQGFSITGSNFSPVSSGWYVYHAEAVGTPMKILKNMTLGTDVFSGVSGLVNLSSTDLYTVDTDGGFTIVGVQ